jgi:hypothetical protein
MGVMEKQATAADLAYGHLRDRLLDGGLSGGDRDDHRAPLGVET